MDENTTPVHKVSRGLKEAIVWRYIAEMMRRYPHRLWVYQAEKETWDEDSKPHLLRFALAFPEFDGRFGELDLLDQDVYRFWTPGGPSWMDGPWQMAVEFDDLKGVLNHLTADIQLHGYVHGHMPPTSTDTLVYRVMAGISAATVFTNHAWRWVNSVRLDGQWLNPSLRTEVLRPFPTLEVPEPRYSDIGNARNDPAYRYWILTRDREPVVCLSTDGHSHLPDGREIDLMSVYDETRTGGAPGRIGPVVHAVGRDFLP